MHTPDQVNGAVRAGSISEDCLHGIAYKDLKGLLEQALMGLPISIFEDRLPYSNPQYAPFCKRVCTQNLKRKSYSYKCNEPQEPESTPS